MSHLWNEYVENGQAFASENFMLAAPGLLNQMQLFNPVASSIRVRLRTVHAILSVAINVNVFRHDTPLATAGPFPGFSIENLLGGGVVNVGEMRSDTPVAASGSLFWQINAAANTPGMYPPEGREWGHDLLPGQGIHLTGIANTTLIANWMWVELPL